MKIVSPRVSVVVPMFNAAPWIGDTLESVFRQTYQHDDIELIVVDDGSQDEGASIARSLIGQHDVRGRVISLGRNRGQGASRNAGWQAASGEWIQLLDADDLLAPNKLQLQAECAARAAGDVAVVYSPWQHFALRDDAWRPVGELEAPNVDADPVLQILQEFEFGYFGPTLIRKSFLQQIGGVKETPCLGEDIDVMLRIAMSGGAFRRANSSAPTFFYRDTPGSLWRFQVRHLDSVRAHYRWLKNVEGYLRGRGDGDLPYEACDALVHRYSRFLEFLQEYDQVLFRDVVGWIRRLGVRVPPGTTRMIRRLSRLIGYQNAMQLRSVYRMRPMLSGR